MRRLQSATSTGASRSSLVSRSRISDRIDRHMIAIPTTSTASSFTSLDSLSSHDRFMSLWNVVIWASPDVALLTSPPASRYPLLPCAFAQTKDASITSVSRNVASGVATITLAPRSEYTETVVIISPFSLSPNHSWRLRTLSSQYVPP